MANKVYLFGLNAFCEHYDRLGEVVRRCIMQATPDQLTVLRLVCCLDRYADASVKARVVALLIPDFEDKLESEGDIIQMTTTLHFYALLSASIQET